MPSRGLTWRRFLPASLVLLVPVLGGAAATAEDPAYAYEPIQEEDEAPGPGVSTAEVCTRCHAGAETAQAMRDAKGRSVAPVDLWRSSMMANSARDPFWRAVVRAEMAATPNAAEAIAAKCLSCHAPLANQVGLDDHGTGDPLHVLDCESELGELARDGVSCTICHGISPEGLGTPASYTAGFVINDQLALYGPHKDPITRPMEFHSGFTPTYGEHITSSAHCGSCHTLITDALSPAGEVVGTGFHEQTTYLEWRNSVFSDEGPDGQTLEEVPGTARSCQDCHTPTTDEDGRPIRTALAHNPGGFDFPFVQPRKPFGRHLFVGGNTFVLSLLRDHAEELGVTAPREAFDATIEATREQLASRTARIGMKEVAAPEGVDGVLAVEVEVTNLTGHKLPSGHPSRRMWLEVVAKTLEGDVVFSSGRWNERGLIVGPDGEALPTERADGPIEPHRDVVAAQDQVARFRGVMADAKGDPTFLLLRGDGWFVDDRLLPRGWSADHPDAAHTGPAGVEGDADFPQGKGSVSDGRDRVTYLVPAPAGVELVIQARLVHQAVSPRYVADALRFEAPEIERFLAMEREADRSPEILASGLWRGSR